MPNAHETPGVAFKNASVVLLARVVGENGSLITSGGINTATYSITRLDPIVPNTETPITGHTAQSLTVASVVFSSLQLDDLWEVDAVGYNFRHVLDIGTHQAFDTAGAFYRVRYVLTPTSGQPIIVRFKLQII